jgi:hypothetical protein
MDYNATLQNGAALYNLETLQLRRKGSHNLYQRL